MPEVPRLQTSDPGLQPMQIARAEAAPDLAALGAGNAQVSESVSKTAGMASRIAMEQQQDANESRLTEVRNAANRWELDNIYGPKGAITKRGKDAFGVQEELSKSFDDFVTEQSKNLSNDAQKLMLEKFAAARKDQVSNWAQAHTATNVKIYKDELYKDSLESSKERASVDPTKIALETTFIEGEVMKQMQGMDPESVQQELQKQKTDLYARVISSMASSGNVDGAQNFYDHVSDQMDPDVKREKIDPFMSEATLRVDSQRSADKIIKGSSSFSEALTKLSGIEDSQLRTETKKKVKDYYDTIKQAKQDLQDEQFRVASNIIEQSPNREAIPPAIWTGLSIEQRNSLDSRAERLKKGLPVETDWETYYDLRGQAVDPSLHDKFLKTNLLQFRDRLADSEFKELVNLQNGSKNGSKVALDELDGYASRQQIFRRTLKEAGLDINAKTGTPEAKALTRFQRMIDQEVDSQQKANGKKLTGEQYQQVVDGLMVQSITTGNDFFGNPKKGRVFELSRGQNYGVMLKDIPANDKEEIKRLLIKAGKPSSDIDIVHVYMQRVQDMVSSQ